ncbi:MAG TPA: NADH-quinone oxidoreductase subunit NuoF [Armatimonadota bacterium]|jgi:NADH-quinone oxidoreductase subunit F
MTTNLTQILSKADLEALKTRAHAALDSDALRVVVCGGTGCSSNGSAEVLIALRQAIAAAGLAIKVDLLDESQMDALSVDFSGCSGFCEVGPIVRILPENIFYVQVKAKDAKDIVERTLIAGQAVDRLLYQDKNTGERYIHRDEIPFYVNQVNIALTDCGLIDPADIRHYIAHNGYEALAQTLEGKTPEDVVQVITDAGLRGRGGGGFPTGRKWGITLKVPGEKKYVICNADEGDPGAFMDRSVLEGNPHAVIEGMILAGFAIGADEGYVYVRAEYPLAVQRMRLAIRQAEQSNLLGDNILNSGFGFHIKIKEGAGAFVCGEETALIASIEGQRGMPRPKPPFPAQSGLWGKPTCVNNVETLANVPRIILRGSEWFRQYGTEKSAGTKVFALTGDVVNTGLIEVPMGTTLGDVVFKVGGGIRGGGEFKTVQIGGPSGGCLTKDHLDLPLDYDSLRSVGAMVGSGGLVVMDDETCMVEVARYFMNFTQSESCGKCVICREGTKRMLEILEKITSGQGVPEDLETLEELAETVRDGSLCGLGKTAPNPVLSTLKYFRHEYEAHVWDKKCPAKQCANFKTYWIDPARCKGCRMCAKQCPVEAITGNLKEPHVIDAEKCIKCGACMDVCRLKAVELQ